MQPRRPHTPDLSYPTLPPTSLFRQSVIGLCHLAASLAYRIELHGLTILVLTLAAIACYATMLAPITWGLITEMFPNPMQSRGLYQSRRSLGGLLCPHLDLSRAQPNGRQLRCVSGL